MKIIKQENALDTIFKQNKKYLEENPLSTIVACPDSPAISRAYREGVYAVEERLRDLGKKPVDGLSSDVKTAKDYPLKHSFAEGVYQRELFIPQGTFLVSHLHRDSYFSWLISGKLTMLTEDGGATLEAPLLLTSSLGCKRILFAHTDSTWITVHPNPTNTTDIELLESKIHVLEGRYEALDNIVDNDDNIVCELNVDNFFEKFLNYCGIKQEGGKLCQVYY